MKLYYKSTLKLSSEYLDTGTGRVSGVVPVMVYDSLPAAMLSQRLFERGINVMPVMYPGVPAKASRLRFFLTAAHRENDIVRAVDATAEEWKRIGEIVKSLGAAQR